MVTLAVSERVVTLAVSERVVTLADVWRALRLVTTVVGAPGERGPGSVKSEGNRGRVDPGSCWASFLPCLLACLPACWPAHGSAGSLKMR